LPSQSPHHGDSCKTRYSMFSFVQNLLGLSEKPISKRKASIAVNKRALKAYVQEKESKRKRHSQRKSHRKVVSESSSSSSSSGEEEPEETCVEDKDDEESLVQEFDFPIKNIQPKVFLLPQEPRKVAKSVDRESVGSHSKSGSTKGSFEKRIEHHDIPESSSRKNAFEIKRLVEDHCMKCNMLTMSDLQIINSDISQNSQYLSKNCDTITWITDPICAQFEFEKFDENLLFVIPTRSKLVPTSSVAFLESVFMEEALKVRTSIIQKRDFCCKDCAAFNVVDFDVEMRLSSVSKFLMGSHCYKKCKEDIKILRSLSTRIITMQRIRARQFSSQQIN